MTADGLSIPIVVSPSTLNLLSQGVWVTVHAEIPYSDVAAAGATLNGIPVESTFADSRGDLLATFIIDDVKEIVEPGAVELTLSGTTKEGEPFSGTDIVQVVSVKGK